MECRIEGCTKEVYVKKRGICAGHYMRWWKGQEVETPLRPRLVDGLPGYNGAHRRITAVRGPASDYACVDCGHVAAHWSMKHDAVDTHIDQWSAEKGRVYSLDVFSYEPRCFPCHFAYDRRHGLRIDAA